MSFCASLKKAKKYAIFVALSLACMYNISATFGRVEIPGSTVGSPPRVRARFVRRRSRLVLV